jgi:hypothetical protein
MIVRLQKMSEVLSVCRLSPGEEIPDWACTGRFYSVTRTDEELSIVCESKYVPAGIKAEQPWRCLKVVGPLDFGLTGIMAALTQPLAADKISIFAVSTFDTDYLMVKTDNYERACLSLTRAGHEILS